MDISLLFVAVGKLIWWLLPLIGSLACGYLAWRIGKYLFLASKGSAKSTLDGLPSTSPLSNENQDTEKTHQNQNNNTNAKIKEIERRNIQ